MFLKQPCNTRLLPALFVLLPVLCGCGGKGDEGSQTARAGTPVLQAVNYPLAYFAERIGGDLVDVQLLAPAGEDPAYWKPSDEAISAFQTADLILLNGADYAQWTAGAPLPRSRCVVSTLNAKDQLIELPADVSHAHGPTGAHTHGRLAFTTWLDFTLARKQARAVGARLKRLLPEHAKRLDETLAALEVDLDGLDHALRTVAADQEKRAWLASHPVYQYLARRYQLNVKSVHWEPEEAPAEGEWVKLKTLLKDHPARFMLWEGEPLSPIRERLDNLGVKIVVFEPCGNRPARGDFLSVMRANLERLKSALAD